jgi:ubiquitin carboxyl-terminal hydrolase 7
MILFRPKFDEPDQNNPDFSLVLSKKQNYDVVSAALAPAVVRRC